MEKRFIFVSWLIDCWVEIKSDDFHSTTQAGLQKLSFAIDGLGGLQPQPGFAKSNGWRVRLHFRTHKSIIWCRSIYSVQTTTIPVRLENCWYKEPINANSKFNYDEILSENLVNGLIVQVENWKLAMTENIFLLNSNFYT